MHIQGCAVKNGPLDQFKQALEELQKIKDGDRPGKATKILYWKRKKEEIDDTFNEIESVIGLLVIELQLDHL